MSYRECERIYAKRAKLSLPIPADEVKTTLRELRKWRSLSDFPSWVHYLVDHYRRSPEDAWRLEVGLSEVCDVARCIEIVWKKRVLPSLKLEDDRAWVQALIPVAQYLDHFLEEGMDEYLADPRVTPGRVEREKALRLLQDPDWVAGWVEDRELAQRIAAVVSTTLGTRVSRTYGNWQNEGFDWLYRGVIAEIGDIAEEVCESRPPSDYPIDASVVPDHWAGYLGGNIVYKMQRALSISDSPFLEVTKRAPQRTVDLVVGARGWTSLLPTMAEIAIKGHGTGWALRMTKTVVEAMERTWHRTGWLQGVEVIGSILQQLDDEEQIHYVRRLAEAALLDLLPPREGSLDPLFRLGRSVGNSLRALAPLSAPAAKRLAQEIGGSEELGWGRREIRRRLANEPWLTRHLEVLEEGGQLDTKRTSLELAIQYIEQMGQCRLEEMGLSCLEMIVSTLSVVGTNEAAVRLATWLAEHAPKVETGPYDTRRENQIIAGLMYWQSDVEHLYRGLNIMLNPSVPQWAWCGYLRGVMRMSGADAAVYLARLMEKEGHEWTAEQREEVVGTLGGYGDERVVPYLAWWLDREWAKEEITDLSLWLWEALWGADGHRGVIVRRSTEWLVNWLKDADVSDRFREMAAYMVLRPRYIVDGEMDERIAELGRRWFTRGIEESNLDLARAGAYLTDKASRGEIGALEALEQGSDPFGQVHIAVRMGMWKVLEPRLKEYIEGGIGRGWEVVELLAEQQVVQAVPLLVGHYLSGKEWIKKAGLGQFQWQDIDAYLDERWEEQSVRMREGSPLVSRLCRLGTPGAISRVLNAWREGVLSSFRFPYFLGKEYREDVWLLLAEFMDEVEDEWQRWDTFRAIQSLWPIGDPWLWEVTAFFFDRLEDPDPDVVQQAEVVLRGAITGLGGYVWEGRAEAYRQGLRKLATEGTERQRQLASWWLDVLMSERMEVSEVDVVAEGTAAGSMADVGREILRLVCQRENIPPDDRTTAREEALSVLITSPRYLLELGQAVQRGDAPDWWLVAAVAAQGVVLEEADGEFFVRWGENLLHPEEWARF